MAELTISISDLLWVAGAVCTLTATWKILKNNPVAKHEKLISEHEKLLREHEKLLREQAETEKLLCKCMLAMIDHEITGNSIDGMKKIRTEMQAYLIEKIEK